jgi:hypothetical protein
MTMTTNTQRASSGRTDPLGVGSRLGHVKRRAPRRMGQWAAAVLFVAMVIIALVALFQSQSDRVEVLVVTDSVPAGQVIERADLRAAEVAGVSGAIRATDLEEVVGQRAAAGLVDGQVLTSQAISEALVPGEGQRLAALNLPTGRVPGGLSGGDIVNVLSVPVEGADGTKEQLQAPQVLAESARVQEVGKTPEGTVVVTVLVPADVANSVAAYSSAGQVTIIQAPAAAGE